MLSKYWPLLDLCIDTPKFQMVCARDEHFEDLADILMRVRQQPHQSWWGAENDGVGTFETKFLQYLWSHRSGWRHDNWRITFVILEDGRARGVQSIWSEKFPALRAVSSGSWLDPEHQGRGIGRMMRSAALHFVFDSLEAVEARTSSRVENAAALSLTRSLGYRENGFLRKARVDEVVVEQEFTMSRGDWFEQQREKFPVSGFDACRFMFFPELAQ